MSENKEPVAAGPIAQETLSRLKATLTKAEAYWKSPEGKARRKRELAEEQARKVQILRDHWNAPERQVSRKNLDRGGSWGAAYNGLVSKVGTGMLIGICGGRGPGKTQLAVELMREVTNQLRSARYETAIGFFMQIKATYKSDSRRTEEDVVHEYARVKLLVLDEISKRGESDWEDRLLAELIDRRYRAMVDTLLIANQDRSQFLAALGPSIASRMSECGGIIECNWKSFRS